MKRTFANLVQKSLVAALLVFGALLFSTSRAEAQASGAVAWPNNFVDSGEALLRIKNAVLSLNNDPQVNNVGTDSYIRVHYFKGVYRRIEGGEPVPNAVEQALPTTKFGSDVANAIPGVTVSQGQSDALRNYLFGLLTQ